MKARETLERRTRRLFNLDGSVSSGSDNKRKIGRCGSSMLRPSPNHETPWLHNNDHDGDDDAIIAMCLPNIYIFYFAVLSV